MELTILGTGAAWAVSYYNTCFVLSDNDRHFLVDGGGGNGLFRQLSSAGFNWMDMRDIFITHRHIDHLMGIIWMVRMITDFMENGRYSGEANIYGHDEVIGLIRDLSAKLLQPKRLKFLDTRLHLITVEDGQTLKIIGHKTVFFDIGSTKAKQFGFSMDIGGSEKLTCCGDEPYSECEAQYVRDSKWLLHEAYCLYSERDIFEPYKIHHSTVKDACELAESMSVPNLVLYHTEDSHYPERKRLFKEEGSRYYHGRLFVPEDLEVFDL